MTIVPTPSIFTPNFISPSPTTTPCACVTDTSSSPSPTSQPFSRDELFQIITIVVAFLTPFLSTISDTLLPEYLKRRRKIRNP
jgi:hypothetical protein